MYKNISKTLILSLLSVISVLGQNEISDIKNQFKIDRRTTVYEIEYISESNTLKGKTNNVAAKKALLEKLKVKNPKDSIVILPNLLPGQQPYVVANVSVVNLRSEPEESAELSSQVLLGIPMKVFEKYRGWYRVQCPDQYIGWVDASTVKPFSENQITDYQKDSLVIFSDFYGKAYRDTSSNALPIRDLTYGNIIVKNKILGKFIEVTFPDKTKGYISVNSAKPIKFWLEKSESYGDEIARFSLNYLGTPYLWGGTSAKGVDCSGFTRMSYLSKGLFLPRDASQQALIGEKVTIDSTFSNLRVGDLLFFGNTETKRVVHVALWLGGLSFIHSSGMVRIESFDPKAHNYSEYNLRRLLFVKRINPESIKLKEGLLYTLTK
ncbi:MAG: C40 family peptidase [Cytophagaceae bacterium]|nr:C40 family peptidase [Cytophagaceae bacterium]MBL0304090.1 C40 family peptidase [Cytophagaceae bacterium]MBL0326900.1 C40 family peptidase [Cytophagaceae bacterium]